MHKPAIPQNERQQSLEDPRHDLAPLYPLLTRFWMAEDYTLSGILKSPP